MTIEIALLISIISVFFGVYQTIVNLKRNQSHDVRNDASQMTTVIVKLENISVGITELKNEMACIKNDIKSDHDRLIKVEESVKSISIRVGKLEGGDDDC